MKRFLLPIFLLIFTNLQSKPPVAIVDRYLDVTQIGDLEYKDTSIIFVCYKNKLIVYNETDKLIYKGKREKKRLWWKPMTFVCNYSFNDVDFSIWFATYGTHLVDVFYKHKNGGGEKYDNSMDILNYKYGKQ